MDELFSTAVHVTARLLEAAGVLVIVVGVVWSTAVFLRRRLGGAGTGDPLQSYRASIGRGILLGLELLVAADIINTVAIDPTLEIVAVLAAIVLIRTFLSFSLEVEIDGRWPWQKKDYSAA